MDYFTLHQSNIIEYEIKRSQFFAMCCNAQTRAQAMDAIAQARAEYPDARHHCWAYLLGSPFQPSSMAASDDGEPSGTAGKPILNVLQHNNVGNVMLIVVRYFGGIKLGAGGLVRAYSSAAQQVIDSAEKTLFVPHCTVSVACDFAQEQYLRHVVNQQCGIVLGAVYETLVTLNIQLPELNLTTFKQQCQLNQWAVTLLL